MLLQSSRFSISSLAVILFSITMIVHLLLLPWAMIDNGDATDRIFIALDWLEKPSIITHGSWLPLPFYLQGITIWLTNDYITAPVVLNGLLAAGTVVTSFLFMTHYVNRRAALSAAALLIGYPAFMRISLQPLSQSCFLFFLALSCLLIVEARAGSRYLLPLLAGVSMTAACASRAEGWILCPALWLVAYQLRSRLLLFALLSISFPLFWMVGNYIYNQDPFFSFNAVSSWEAHSEGRTLTADLEIYLARFLRFPLTIAHGLTPFLAIPIFLGVAQSIRTKHPLRNWLWPSGLLAIALWVKTVDGSLAWMVHYSVVFGVLLIPFIGLTIESSCNWPSLRTVLICAATVFYSFVSDSAFPPQAYRYVDKIAPVPRLPSELHAVLSQIRIETTNKTTSALVLDFIGWPQTRYLALRSGLSPSQIFYTPGGRLQSLSPLDLYAFIFRHEHGVMVTVDGGRLDRLVEQHDQLSTYGVTLEKKSQVHDLTIWRYSKNSPR